MQCLLDKVTARHILQGVLKLTEGRDPTDAELLALDFFTRAHAHGAFLYVVPQTEKLLRRLENHPRYNSLIRFFRSHISAAQPTRYFKRWARRLREYGFTPEDAGVLALATFGKGSDPLLLGMHVVVTSDQPMIHRWTAQQDAIEKRLANMRKNLRKPYRDASLPTIGHPEEILI